MRNLCNLCMTILLSACIIFFGNGVLEAKLALKTADSCTLIREGRVGRQDATPIILDCMNNSRSSVLDFAPVSFYIITPLSIDRTIEFRTVNSDSSRKACGPIMSDCARLIIEVEPTPNRMPITVRAPNVTMSHLAIFGSSGAERADDKLRCQSLELIPSGGGVRVVGEDFRIEYSWIHNFACFTAMEVESVASGLSIVNNRFGPNGRHVSDRSWSDGLTVHDNHNSIISGNYFTDNTDVQMILGGCQECLITKNIFSHTADVNAGAFAELMLHKFVGRSSGNFSGTIISKNEIDCGPYKGCGFGVEIGPNPWSPAGSVYGGDVVDNMISNAKVAINVDGLSGVVHIDNNLIRMSGGYSNACGGGTWSAVNVALGSVGFAKGSNTEQAGHRDSTHCLLNRPIQNN